MWEALQAVSCHWHLRRLGGSVSADSFVSLAELLLLLQVLLLDSLSRPVTAALAVGVLVAGAQCTQCSKTFHSSIDCYEAESLILNEDLPHTTGTPTASSGCLDAGPLCCLGHAHGIADEAAEGFGGSTLAATDECQTPDAHYHAQQSLDDVLSRFGCLAAVSLGGNTPFGLRGAGGFEAHGMVVEADLTHSSVGLVLSGLLVTMLVGSVRRGPMVTVGVAFRVRSSRADNKASVASGT